VLLRQPDATGVFIGLTWCSPAIFKLDAAMRSRQPGAHGGASAMWSERQTEEATCTRPNPSRINRSMQAVAVMVAIGRTMVENEQRSGLEGFLAHPIFG
jgi:hypothetical protein